jgi:hypothetical protein
VTEAAAKPVRKPAARKPAARKAAAETPAAKAVGGRTGRAVRRRPRVPRNRSSAFPLSGW